LSALVGMTMAEARRTFSGLSPEAIARAAAGLPVQRGTEALIRGALAGSEPAPEEHAT